MATEKRLIDMCSFREVLRRYLNAPHVSSANNYARGLRDAIKSCLDLLENQRPVDAAEVVRGEWVIDRDPVSAEFKCSACGFSYIDADSYATDGYNYCPDCGAKMDGGA